MNTAALPSPRPATTIPLNSQETFPGWIRDDSSLFSWAGEDTVRAAIAGAARLGISPRTLLACRSAARAAATAKAIAAAWQPEVLISGPAAGPLEVLIRHLRNQQAWSVAWLPETVTPIEGLDGCAPDLLVMVWTDEPSVKLQVASIRHHPNGRRLPVIILGSPSPNGGSQPVQPVRGVLCLPSPLKWRTLLVCLDEHLKILRSRVTR